MYKDVYLQETGIFIQRNDHYKSKKIYDTVSADQNNYLPENINLTCVCVFESKRL